MATARLSDSQKQELVQRFRQGENTQALADHFGCSSTTVTRLVRSELGEEAYGALREERQKKGGRDRQIPLAIGSPSPAIGTTEADGASAQPDPPVAALVAEAPPEAAPARSGRRRSSAATPAANLPEAAAATVAAVPPVAPTAVISENALEQAENALEPAEEKTITLAIDDADDFGEDDGEDDLLSSDDDGDEDGSQDAEEFHTVAVLPISVDDQQEIRPAPWSPAVLPSCAYLLVDKTVELQARPLAEMPELGRLPSEEQQRQALVLFTNPRQAKRQCGRTQRVIKLPDPALLGRTAPYLLAQGISRVVIEGALYALPDQ